MMNFYLPHRKDGEQIVLLLRRHAIIIFIKIFFWIIVALLPLGLFIMLSSNVAFENLLGNSTVWAIIILFTSVYYLFVWLLTLYSFVDYYLDVWIVTSHRIISIEQAGLFNRTISEQELYRVQDVTSEVKGVLPTLLDYGMVDIQTAGEEERFVFKQVPHPSEVAKKITSMVEDNKRTHHVQLEQAAAANVRWRMDAR